MHTLALDRALIVTSIVGLLLSRYALHVETFADDPGYTAMCDIGKYSSCSKVLTSKYSKGFGLLPDSSPMNVPNCMYGIFFYCQMIPLSIYSHRLIVRLQLLFAICSAASSVYLAYLLAFVLHEFCILCVSTYLVNGLLVFFCWKKVNFLKSLALKNK